MSDPARNAAGYSHEAIDRTVRVLEAFSGDGPLSLAEVARSASLNDATALRYLTSLCNHGLVERVPESGRYRLGIRLFELGQRALLGRDPRQLARPYMEALLSQFEETVNLAMHHGDELIVIEVIESRQSIKKGAMVGERDRWHASSLGKAILAQMPASEAERLVSSTGLLPLTQSTITSADVLFEQLAAVRELGYAVDDEETLENLRCAGAAVFDRHGIPAYALSVAGPKDRIPARRLREIGAAVQLAASALSAELGHTVAPSLDGLAARSLTDAGPA
ncbi:MAG TPA: IclR family transcriptional regulator [Gaiellaceae bacterium]|nr:IclR family transcriptional regulator [Gaiellaceae bacterium]